MKTCFCRKSDCEAVWLSPPIYEVVVCKSGYKKVTNSWASFLEMWKMKY